MFEGGERIHLVKVAAGLVDRYDAGVVGLAPEGSQDQALDLGKFGHEYQINAVPF